MENNNSNLDLPLSQDQKDQKIFNSCGNLEQLSQNLLADKENIKNTSQTMFQSQAK